MWSGVGKKLENEREIFFFLVFFFFFFLFHVIDCLFIFTNCNINGILALSVMNNIRKKLVMIAADMRIKS